jgi:hypothetical protein
MPQTTKKPEPSREAARPQTVSDSSGPAAGAPAARPEPPRLPDSREVLRVARTEALGLSMAARLF